MSNATISDCPAPFLNQAHYPDTGGIIAGRLCAPLSQWDANNDLTCCLPCPSSDFVYPKGFVTWYRLSEGINALSIALCLFLLVSFIALPADKTRRHYLSVCLVIAVIVEGLGFVVPLAVRPDQCHDAITPNDMFSSLTCAWSGALIISGGLGIAVWIFVRALSIHLQICWDIVPGTKFFYSAQAAGWGIVAVLFTLTTVITGFSFRFGDACHVNSKDSLKTFWAPLLTISGLAALMQIATTAYCIKVYLGNMWNDDGSASNITGSTHLPSYTSSINTRSARAVYQRVRKCLWLQWRSMLIVVFVLADVVFFSVVFLWMDNVIIDIKHKHLARVLPWLACLFENGKATEQCLNLGQQAIVKEGTVVAVLLLLALAGTQVFLLLFRNSMLGGWRDFFAKRFSRDREFVSVDAKRLSAENAKPFELHRMGSSDPMVSPHSSGYSIYKAQDSVNEIGSFNATPPAYETTVERLTRQVSNKRDFESTVTTTITGGNHHHKKSSTRDSMRDSTGSREYRVADYSVSGPRRSGQAWRLSQEQPWDPRASYARGGLASHPPTQEEDDYNTMRNRT